MIPLKDENPINSKSYIRLIILIVCSLIFLFQSFGGINSFLIGYFGFKPVSLIDSSGIETFIPFLTIFTSMFMHGGWLHFLGNMLYLWIFADNVEDALGHKKFLIFYLFSGVFASLSQFVFDINSPIPMIGASGAIAGVLGAYFYLFPKAKVLVLIPFIIFFTIRVPASILLLFWFFYQFININDEQSNIAWIAHIGGFIFGLIYVIATGAKKIESKKGKSVFLKNRKGPWD
jgi:membrane associated rhomboid family serine protease